MNDDKFAWPRTEVRRRPASTPRKRQPIGRAEVEALRRFRQAQHLAIRWDRGDEDVTVQDIIDALLRHKPCTSGK